MQFDVKFSIPVELICIDLEFYGSNGDKEAEMRRILDRMLKTWVVVGREITEDLYANKTVWRVTVQGTWRSKIKDQIDGKKD